METEKAIPKITLNTVNKVHWEIIKENGIATHVKITPEVTEDAEFEVVEPKQNPPS